LFWRPCSLDFGPLQLRNGPKSRDVYKTKFFSRIVNSKLVSDYAFSQTSLGK